jgi:hypothetical protein
MRGKTRISQLVTPGALSAFALVSAKFTHSCNVSLKVWARPGKTP